MAVHVLFLLDDYSEVLGGAYYLQRGLIESLRKHYQDSDDALTISCTCLKTSSQTTTPTADCDIQLVQLDGFTGDDADELVDKVSGNVTHIVCFASHSKEWLAEGGILQRYVQKCPVRPGTSRRLILVNNDSSSERIKLIMNELPKELTPVMVFSLKETCYDSSVNYIKKVSGEANPGKSHCKELYPPPCKGRLMKGSAPPECSIVVFLPHSPQKGFTDEFLQKLYISAKSLVQDAKNLGKKCEIKWTVCCESETSDQFVPVALKEHVRYLDRTSKEKFDEYLALANLCIADGMFHSHMYSGLETLLFGIPTIVMEDSDVSQVLKDIRVATHTFFTISPNADNKTICKTFRLILLEQGVFKEANEFAAKYDIYPTVRKSIEEFLDVFPKPPKKFKAKPEEPSLESLGVNLRRGLHNNHTNRDDTSVKSVDGDDNTSLKRPYGDSNAVNDDDDTNLKQTYGSLQTDGPPDGLENIPHFNIQSKVENNREHDTLQSEKDRYNRVHYNTLENNNNSRDRLYSDDIQSSRQDPMVFERLANTISQLSPISPVFQPFPQPVSIPDETALQLSHNMLPPLSNPSINQMDMLKGAFILQTDCKSSPHSNRKDFKSLSDSEGSSSQDEDGEDCGIPLPRQDTPPSSRKNTGADRGGSLFTTSKPSRSQLSKKIDKIKKTAQKSVKDKSKK